MESEARTLLPARCPSGFLTLEIWDAAGASMTGGQRIRLRDGTKDNETQLRGT